MERTSVMNTTTSYGATDNPRRSSSTKSSSNDVLPTINIPHTSSAANGTSGNGHSNGDGDAISRKRSQAMREWLAKSVESKECSLISVANCFLTGFTSAVAFSACYIWCVFPLSSFYITATAEHQRPGVQFTTMAPAAHPLSPSVPVSLAPLARLTIGPASKPATSPNSPSPSRASSTRLPSAPVGSKRATSKP